LKSRGVFIWASRCFPTVYAPPASSFTNLYKNSSKTPARHTRRGCLSSARRAAGANLRQQFPSISLQNAFHFIRRQSGIADRIDGLDETKRRVIAAEYKTLGRELSLPWFAKLDAAVLPTGSARPWISKSKDGLLVLKA